MAAKSSTSGFITTCALILVFLLFAFLLLFASLYDEMVKAEAKLCEKRSKTWSGFCGSSPKCDKKCKEGEDAKHGSCHFEFPGFACFCYFDC